MKIAIKRVGEPLEIIETDVTYRCELKTLVVSDNANSIESVFFPKNVQLIVDECGCLKNLPHNFYISCKSSMYPIQTIVGTVLFAKFKPLPMFEEAYDYELIDLTEEDIQYINNVLSDEIQEQLKRSFDDTYKNRTYGDWYLTEVKGEI